MQAGDRVALAVAWAVDTTPKSPSGRRASAEARHLDLDSAAVDSAVVTSAVVVISEEVAEVAEEDLAVVEGMVGAAVSATPTALLMALRLVLEVALAAVMEVEVEATVVVAAAASMTADPAMRTTNLFLPAAAEDIKIAIGIVIETMAAVVDRSGHMKVGMTTHDRGDAIE